MATVQVSSILTTAEVPPVVGAPKVRFRMISATATPVATVEDGVRFLYVDDEGVAYRYRFAQIFNGQIYYLDGLP